MGVSGSELCAPDQSRCYMYFGLYQVSDGEGPKATCWSKIIALIRDTPGDIAFFVHDILRYYHLTELRYFG